MHILTNDQLSTGSSAIGDKALSSVIKALLPRACGMNTEGSNDISAELIADAATLVRKRPDHL